MYALHGGGTLVTTSPADRATLARGRPCVLRNLVIIRIGKAIQKDVWSSLQVKAVWAELSAVEPGPKERG